MRQVVLETEISDIGEPVSTVLTEAGEELNDNVVEDVTLEMADHAE